MSHSWASRKRLVLDRAARGAAPQPYLAPDDVRHLHEVVVDDVGKVVGREAVRLDEDKVLFGILLLVGAVNGIAELDAGGSIALEAHDMGLAGGGKPDRLGRIHGPARARVEGGHAGVVELALLGLELLGAAEAAIGVARVYQLLRMVPVDCQALRLDGAGASALAAHALAHRQGRHGTWR